MEVNPLSHYLKNFQYLHQLVVIHKRGLNVYLWNNDSTERNGKGIQSPNYMYIMDLYNLEIMCKLVFIKVTEIKS